MQTSNAQKTRRKFEMTIFLYVQIVLQVIERKRCGRSNLGWEKQRITGNLPQACICCACIPVQVQHTEKECSTVIGARAHSALKIARTATGVSLKNFYEKARDEAASDCDFYLRCLEQFLAETEGMRRLLL